MFLRSAVALVLVYAALAVLFALDAFRGIDQWAVDRLMPGAEFTDKEPSLLDSLVPLLHAGWGSGWDVAANIVTFPAGFVVSLVLVTLLSRRLGLVLLAAVVVEAICKRTLEGPALYDGSLHIAAFDSSFPSGHTLRAVILAGAVAVLFPRVRSLAVAWAAAAIALLVLAGWHTPSDLAGGLVLGLLALLGARAAGALRARRLPARA